MQQQQQQQKPKNRRGLNSKRGLNCKAYKWHITGELCGVAIDKKYCSLNEFIAEYSGEKTCMNLNKDKIMRLKRKWTGNHKKPKYKPDKSDELIKKNWNVYFTAIYEKRESKKMYATE